MEPGTAGKTAPQSNRSGLQPDGIERQADDHRARHSWRLRVPGGRPTHACSLKPMRGLPRLGIPRGRIEFVQRFSSLFQPGTHFCATDMGGFRRIKSSCRDFLLHERNIAFDSFQGLIVR